MSQHNHEVYIDPIRTDISLYDTKEVAHTVQSILWDDFSRLHNADLDDLRTLCDPRDEAKVELQAGRLSRAPDDTHYYGMYEPGNPDMIGVAKIAPWGTEYERSFTSPTLVRLKSLLKLDKKAVGLDAFALKSTDNRSGLTRAALNSIYWNDRIIPVDAELKAVVDVNDEELIEAFDELGAAAHEKIATIHLNDWTRDYTLRTLPAKQRTARPAW
ncbi:hypothetical protein A2707_00640 [Candidatus Saccharibacteria bacterium RIFCSPHIGHO2_01_FULL_45_15]|nr:MAG: hypothetical protein A2707_00640 [Candidatus Saccharibacteria bacterium RIFCSPHIGHO2_01_FULL_45_15]OGL26883.1 MAG: hypothetical protein A3C39_01755 [Candidatus Saccharibacteria bacterium RIFCSPHIGHO2_02_FULL_46_12]OGL32191.1 MAG: hypothetical protein A3E76_04300 [Candidatus Saccharibacteria bacterium RIFCSPHIGHO2_12_FULL_44_22]